MVRNDDYEIELLPPTCAQALAVLNVLKRYTFRHDRCEHLLSRLAPSKNVILAESINNSRQSIINSYFSNPHSSQDQLILPVVFV